VLRHPNFIRFLLLAFGALPVAAWIAFAASLEPSGMGRSIGRAILVVLAPLPFGGLLMIFGAGLMRRRPQAARIVATVGAAIAGLGTAFIATVWGRRFASCGGPDGICTPELLEALALLAFAVLHGWLIVLVWRMRKNSSPQDTTG